MMSKSFIHADDEPLNCDCAEGNCFLKCLYFVLGMGVLMELLLGGRPFDGGFSDQMWVHDVYFVSFILSVIALSQWAYQSFNQKDAGNAGNEKLNPGDNKSINYNNYLKGGGLLLISIFIVTGCIAIIISAMTSGVVREVFQSDMMVHKYLMYLVYGYIPFYYFGKRFLAG